jgi:hypothetical protein
MPRLTVMDELHVRLAVPPGRPAAARAAVCRHSANPNFGRQVIRAVRALLYGRPELAALNMRLSRGPIAE